MNARPVTDYATALEFLLGRVNYERTSHIPYQSDGFKLDRMRRLLAAVDDPHLELKAIHIAGTKGKGSTAAMIAEVLTAAGYKTGLYTSPHLDRIEERIAIGGAICPDVRLVALAARLQEALGRIDLPEGGPTFFEITTALAFLHFAESRVDAAVLEVGLGGRLDSTNVCRPEVTVITSISFDHMRQLGNTLAAIAGEKAGIIKPGVPVISGVVRDEPRQVIVERAREAHAPLYQRGVDFGFTRRLSSSAAGEAIDYWESKKDGLETRPTEFRDLGLAMPGEHQAANAACAVAAVLRLNERGWEVSEDAIRAGLAIARCPARIELLSGQPAVVLDVAHNPASIAALLDVLDERLPGRRKVLIFASSKDKDYAAMLRLVLPRFDAVVLTQYIENPRAMEAEQLAEVAREMTASARRPAVIEVAATPAEALACARHLAGPEDAICITGSFFLAAELRPLLAPSRVEPAGDRVTLAAR
jgi:dihydrofolate synthase/folylpolyglutamate synthase